MELVDPDGSNLTINFTEDDIARIIKGNLGETKKDLASVVVLTLVYTVIFLTGVIGNVSTCIVITRNSYMHTVTNYYLLSLAISDVLALILGK
jgi:neuromedin U receptor 1